VIRKKNNAVLKVDILEFVSHFLSILMESPAKKKVLIKARNDKNTFYKNKRYRTR